MSNAIWAVGRPSGRAAFGLAAVGVTVTMNVGTPLAQANSDEPRGRFVSDDTVIAVFDQELAPDDSVHQRAAIAAVAGEVVWRARTVPGLVAIRVPRGWSDVAASYLRTSRVAPRAEAAHDAGFAYGAVPNDADYGRQWGLKNTGQTFVCTDNGQNTTITAVAGYDIGVEHAWNIRTDCSRKVVAVVDSGVWYPHDELFANMWINPDEVSGNGLDDDNNGVVDDVYGANFRDDDPLCYVPGYPLPNKGDPIEYPKLGVYHGTPVAAIIGAAGNNRAGMTGICWTAQIMAIRASSYTYMFSSCSDVFCENNPDLHALHHIRAIDYAVAEGAHIINASWGFQYDPVGLLEVIEMARLAGVIFVAIAHNDSIDIDLSTGIAKRFPCVYNLDNIICVGNLGPDGQLHSTSNFGRQSVDIVAPGQYSAATLGLGLFPPIEYCPTENCFGGTSAAAPHVSGAIALLWSHYPTWTYSQVLDRVYSRARYLPQLSGQVRTGSMLDMTLLLD
ncbi:MAG: S8 family serine peptidase [Planctomycetota bacterium]|nr:S8 family serine peptidase [Planctomycetota bacterium]